MNNRNGQWRKKLSPKIEELIGIAAELKLYLLQENGPTSFVFKDELENKIKTSIGSTITCSCSSNTRDHCVHTLYVFLKIFKIDKENALLWQTSYLDNEISDLLKNRFNSTVVNNNNDNNSQRTKSTINKKIRSSSTGQQSLLVSVRQKLEDDVICPICHENMDEDEGLTFCKKGCGNNFHIKCIIIWGEHKKSVKEPISCPMCRCDWGPKALELLKDEQGEFELRWIVHKGHKCIRCNNGKNIKGKLFHCVYCENVELCERCFLGYEHFEHERFLVKENVKAEWFPATDREKIYIKTAEDHIGLAQELAANSHTAASAEHKINLINKFTQQMTSSILQSKIQDWSIDRATSIEKFLLSCFPGYGYDVQEKKSNKVELAIFGRDFKKCCIVCKKDKGDAKRLKKMDCGHAIDDDCLIELYQKKIFCCPEDGIDIFKGFVKVLFPHVKGQILNSNINEIKKDKLPAINIKSHLSKENLKIRRKTFVNTSIKMTDFDCTTGFECSGKKLSSMNTTNGGMHSLSLRQHQSAKDIIYISPEIIHYNQETGLEIVYEEDHSNLIDKLSTGNFPHMQPPIGLLSRDMSAIPKENEKKNKINNMDDQFEIKGCNPYQKPLLNLNHSRKLSDMPNLQNRVLMKTSKKLRLSSNPKEKDKLSNILLQQINDIVLVGNTLNSILPKGKINLTKHHSHKAITHSEIPEIHIIDQMEG